jgi:hypothetical protein
MIIPQYYIDNVVLAAKNFSHVMVDREIFDILIDRLLISKETDSNLYYHLISLPETRLVWNLFSHNQGPSLMVLLNYSEWSDPILIKDFKAWLRFRSFL